MKPAPINPNDFEMYDNLCDFVFMWKKDVSHKITDHKSDRYEILAIHPDKSNERYHMLVTYVMPCDVLIDWLKLTEYRIVSIRKFTKTESEERKLK